MFGNLVPIDVCPNSLCRRSLHLRRIVNVAHHYLRDSISRQSYLNLQDHIYRWFHCHQFYQGM